MNLKNNVEQLKAFMLVANQLILKLPTQLLLYVGGVGGTGKSHIIKSIVMLFERLDRKKELKLGAPTGIAATLIGDQTLHSLTLQSPNSSKKVNYAALAQIWGEVKFLVVDEISMVGAAFMDQLSLRMRHGKGADLVDRERPFGGIHVVFMGDFGQLDPPKQYPLFSYVLVKSPSFSESRNNSKISALNGAFLWRLVTNVILLTKNVRQADDPSYSDFLSRLRIQKCLRISAPGDHDDLRYVSSRLLLNLQKQPEVLEKFWNAPIIVGSKFLRDGLNRRLVEYHARRQNSEVAEYYSLDKIRGAEPSSDELRKKLWDIESNVHHDAFGRLQLFTGMKVMLTENLAFDNGVVNGSEGILIEIKYEEVRGRRFATVAYVQIKGCNINAPGESDPDVVPIFPSNSSVGCSHIIHPGLTNMSFRRTQLPLVPTYAYTDYKSQGRTLERIIVDLASANGQGAYVMLSRVKSLSGLVILRWFPPTKIYGRMSEDLRNELKRLSLLEVATSTNTHTTLYSRRNALEATQVQDNHEELATE